jgi:teichuronic acid biosynthesis glycosyltransferase TuaC
MGKQRKELTVLHLTSMYPRPRYPTSGTFVKNLVDGLARNNIINEVMIIPSPESRLGYLTVIPAFLRHCRSHEYDLVHAQYAHAVIISALQNYVPTIGQFHGEFYGVKDRILADLASRFVSFGIAVDKKGFEKIHCPVKTLIPIGVDSSVFFPRTRDSCRSVLKWDVRKKYIVFPGDPGVPEKNYRLFTRTLELIKREQNDVEPVILKDIPHTQVPTYMNAADALLMTSEFEASPTVIKEALLCNLPIISTHVGDVKNLIDNVDNCVVTSSNAADLALNAITIVGNGKRTNGWKKRSTLDIQYTVEHVINFYDEAIKIWQKRAK